MKKRLLTLCLVFLVFGPNTTWPSQADEDVDPVWMKRAWCHHQNGRYAESIGILEQLVTRHPGSYRPYYYLGLSYREVGFFEQAVACFLQSKRLNPDTPAIDYTIAESYYLAGMWDLTNGRTSLAMGHFQKGVRANPQYAANYYWIGLIHLYQSEYAQAIPWLEQARAVQPNDFHVRRDLGLCYLKLDCLGQARLEQARLELEQALRLNPASFSARFNLGLVYSRMGFWPQAWQEFYLAVTMGESVDTFKPHL